MSVKVTILSHLEQVAAEQGKSLAPLVDDLQLFDSGLDSLCFAIVVARLEDALGVDPFSTREEIHFPVTVGDLINCYDRAL